MNNNGFQTRIIFNIQRDRVDVLSCEFLEELIGHKDQFLLDQTIFFKDLIHTHDDDIYQIIIASETTFTTESLNFRLRQSNGKILCVKSFYDKSYDVQSQILRVDLRLQDVKTLPRTMEEAASTLAFKLMMETTDDFIFFKDRNHVFTGASASLAALFSSVSHWSELIGLTDYDVFEESLADEYYRLEKEVFNGDDIAREEQKFVTKDGKNGWVDNRKYPIKDSNGHIIGLYGIARDITHTHLLEEKLRKEHETLQLILDYAPIGIWLQDGKGKLSFVNRAFTQAMGIEEETFLNSDHYINLIPEIFRPQCLASDEKALQSDGISVSHQQLPFADGKIHDLKVIKAIKRNEIDEVTALVGLSLDITEELKQQEYLKQTSKVLEENQKLLRTVIDEMPSVLVVKDAKGNFLLGNKTVANFYGTTPDEMIGKHDDDFGVPKEIADGFRENVLSIMKKGETQIVIEDSIDASTGELRHFKSIKKPFIGSDGNQQILVIATDITEILDAQKKVIESEHILQEVMEITHEGIWDWHIPSGKVTHNQQWYTLLKLVPDENLEGIETFELIIHPEDKVLVKERLNLYLNGVESVYHSEHRLMCSDGSEIWVQDRGEVIERNDNGEPIRMVGAFTDITYRKKHQEELEYMAHYDLLTGLPNRILETDRLKNAMAHVKRNGGYLAVIYLDLDGFKEVNDSYGHNIGDFILIEVSKNMEKTLREVDTIARLGGDEFVVIISDLSSKNEVFTVVERLLEEARKPICVDDSLVSLSASVGLTFYPQADDVDGDQLIRQADLAMYQAKQSGKNNYYIFDTESDKETRTQHETMQSIEKALNNDEFVLHYQPKVNMSTKQVIGAEALIRWNHPIKGLLYPIDFIPISENSVLASKIGEWVIDTALQQIAKWTLLGYQIPISVNVGATQLLKSDFVERINYLLSKHPSVDPKMIEIEVLETSALEDIQLASKIMKDCSKMKIHFSLDDFGTGYSSLSYLKKLPITTLKIDQSFIRDILNDVDDCLIVIGIIGLAKAFGKNIIAEGVESPEIAEKLIALGCECGQGYAISRPVNSSDFIDWMNLWSQKS